MSLDNKRHCIVTGGAGFIGSHLVERLLDDGHIVTIIDNFANGRPDNLLPVKDRAGLTVKALDVADHDAIRPLFEGVDWVFHLAALADIVPSIQRPFDYHHANVDGTMSVLEAARAAGVKRFVYAASSSCYGLPEVTPTPESAPAQPMYPYALTKWVGEQYVMHWAQTYQLPAVSLRLFNVFGPRHRTTGAYGAVFGVFLAQKLAGRPYTVVGDGSQTRDFTFVTDVVDAFVTAAASDVAGEIMNVGSGGTYSVTRLVDLLGGPRIHIPKRPGEPDCTFADTAKIRRLLGWTPKVRFEDGVATMLDNIEYWRDAPVWTPDGIAAATADWFKHLGR
ncbi:UDP-glucose 4-epimerase [Candidatus Terasakiella magnetica]|nr:UDP-glucose 4-epimerase [Candidatus Terasakiella magnetica]